MERASRLQAQLKQAEERLQRAAALEAELAADRGKAEEAAASAKKREQEQKAKTRSAEALVQAEAKQLRSAQAELETRRQEDAKRVRDMASMKALMEKMRDIAEHALKGKQAAEVLHSKSDLEKRAMQELRQSYDQVKQTRKQTQQAQAEADQARRAQAAAKDRIAHAPMAGMALPIQQPVAGPMV